LRVAINVSPVDLRDVRFGEKLLEFLTEQENAPNSIEVEITETGIIENMGTAIKTIEILREHDVTLSLDYFGTGYSSLSHLNALPLDVLKIGCPKNR